MKTLFTLLIIFALVHIGFPASSPGAQGLATLVFWVCYEFLGHYGVLVGGLALFGLYCLLGQ